MRCATRWLATALATSASAPDEFGTPAPAAHVGVRRRVAIAGHGGGAPGSLRQLTDRDTPGAIVADLPGMPRTAMER